MCFEHIILDCKLKIQKTEKYKRYKVIINKRACTKAKCCFLTDFHWIILNVPVISTVSSSIEHELK